MKKKKRIRSCCLISLGCPKNLVDSEKVLGLLSERGVRIVQKPEKADLVIINTCAFIRPAREESRETIAEMLWLKKRGKVRKVGAIGCFPQYGKVTNRPLLNEFPELDFALGVFARSEITTVLDTVEGGAPVTEIVSDPSGAVLDDSGRYRVTFPHVAYLKIAEGCNRRCAYCTIPSIRGPQQSKPLDQVVEEAETLAADGVRELVLIAQDTTAYGTDFSDGPRLAELLDALEPVAGIEWIRLMYLYPHRYLLESLIDAVNRNAKVLPYFDIPLQHSETEILKRMGRAASRAFLEELLGTIRDRVEGAVLRTTFITGFPGETDAHFEALADFVRAQRFERLGVFAYCDEPGTPAAELDQKVPQQVAFKRCDRLLDLQEELATAYAKSRIGETVDVLVDAPLEEQLAYVGRTPADAPDIDPVAYVTGKRLKPGRITACEIVASKRYDLVGVPGASGVQ